MKKILILLSACLFSFGQAIADNVLTVGNVILPQGGEATLEVGCEFDTEYTAFELQIALPEGITLKSDADGYPVIEKAFDANHVLTGNLLPSNGNYKITCRSMENLSMPTDGALFRVTLVADPSLAVGANMNATLTSCEFTRTADSQGESLSDVEFAVNISEFRTILDEASTTPPVVEENANVRVRRTINAGEWSTICLPFAMTTAQCKAAFGDDVELADFNDYVFNDAEGSIYVNFTDATAIEANHPYIIKVASDITEFTVDDVDIDPQEAVVDFDTSRRKNQPRQFVGTFVANTVLDWGTLCLKDNSFWYSVGETKMKAFRGYFNFYDLIPDFENNYEARVFMTFNDETTIIRQIKNEGEMVNNLYNLNGQRVKAAKKGLYILNGKKVVK